MGDRRDPSGPAPHSSGDTLAERIASRLVERGLVMRGDDGGLADSLAAGALTAADWARLAERLHERREEELER